MGKGHGGRGKAREEDEDEDEDDEADAMEAESDEDAELFGSQASAQAEGEDADGAGSADGDVARSPFGPETFPSAKACWDHAAECCGFSLARLRTEVGAEAWTDYHRIRLVNYLRTIGPEAARQEAPKLGKDSPIWTDDSLLQPKLEDDLLLFEDDDDDEIDGEAQPFGGDAQPCAGTSVAEVVSLEAPPSSAGPPEVQDEVARLRAECESLRRLLWMADNEENLSMAAGGPGGSDLNAAAKAAGEPESGAGDYDLERSRMLVQDPALGETFRQFALASPGLLEGRRVLDASCGAGVLSCLCAKLGASGVVAVERSPAALAAARAGVAANSCEAEVSVLEGRADEDLPELSALRSSGGKSPGFDVLISERFLGDLRYAPPLLALLAARRRWLRPGGCVVPARLRLWMCAADFSQEASAAEAWHQPLLGGLNLARLAPGAPAAAAVDAERVASVQPVELLALDLATASLEEALPSQVPFSMDLRHDRCATALALYLELQLGEEASAGEVSTAPSSPSTAPSSPSTAPSSPSTRRRHVVLHLPAPGPPPARALRLPGAEFPRLEGRFSADWDRGGSRLALSVSITAHSEGGTELRSSAVVGVA